MDCHYKENARTKIKLLVKRIQKGFSYPPDLAGGAVQTVIAQAEVLLREVVP